MKRLLSLALVVAGAWAGTATPSHAGAFGLFYCNCNCCSVCIRPFNAFTPVSCGGIVDGGYGLGVNGFKLPGLDGNVAPPCSYDNGLSAFGTNCCVGYQGSPAGHCFHHGQGLTYCQGYAAPPGPFVAPPVNTCGTWFAPIPQGAPCAGGGCPTGR
jgi:hypothetical protein